VAYGPCLNPTTKALAREALLHQILYGDTDSLHFHATHVKRILEWQATRPVEEHILYESKAKTPGILTKLGKFADEQEPDDATYEPDFANGVHVKVMRFASNAPKSYTMKSVTPGGKVLYKSRCKGVPVNRAQLSPEHGGESVTFDPKSAFVHNVMYDSIVSTTNAIKTRTTQTIKRQGIMVRRFETTTDKEGGVHRVEPWAIGVTNIERKICSDGEDLRWNRRRRLTEEEAQHLEIDEEDRKRILVPLGWNYDGRLFELE
jgi:hypothetical protein